MYKNDNKGFTLLELLVVIAIIGILSAVALTAMSSARASGRDGKRISDIKQLQNGLELYYTTVKQYPTVLATISPTYIKIIPTDPKTGGAYYYVPLGGVGNCTGYQIGANLESTNKVLTTDSDFDSNALGSGQKCGSTTSYYGANPDCSNTATGTERCYDLVK